MKNLVVLIFLTSSLTILSCTQKHDYGRPSTDLASLERDFKKWWTYQSNNIILSSEFVPVDVNSNKISKDEFLKNLTTGLYVPLKLNSKDSLPCYRLFSLDKSADDGIRKTIISLSSFTYDLFKQEGKPFPSFSFTDLKGKTFNNENTKGKYVVLKCWFIGCHACIAEFPELNDLVERYQNRDDIIFISLALDSEKELTQFLLNKPFKFAVIPDQKDFIVKTLNVSHYPTLFIIGRNGTIEKIANKSSEMINSLEKKVL